MPADWYIYNSRNYKVFIDSFCLTVQRYGIYNSRNYKVFIDALHEMEVWLQSTIVEIIRSL